MVEIPKNIQEKIDAKDKGFISEILEELYSICRETGRTCTDCSFEYDKLVFLIYNANRAENIGIWGMEGVVVCCVSNTLILTTDGLTCA